MSSNVKELKYHLRKASKALKNNQDYSKELNNTCKLIDGYIKNSPNIAKAVFEIERYCLEFDKSININNYIERIDSRLTGCYAALEELRSLQDDPEHAKRFKNFLPNNINSKTAYTKEAFNCLRYLGNEKKSNATTRTLHNFYEKRQDIIKQGKQAFLKEKQQKFEQTKLLQQEKIIKKDKGLER